jgi:TRAP-type uncharacterized transport system substrate-binding protein
MNYKLKLKLKLLLIFIIIIILFYIINKKIIIQKENYLTYYLPFYNIDSNILNKFYKDHNYSKNYFKKKFDYQIVKLGSSNYSYKFNTIFSKIIVDKTMSYSVSSINYYNELTLINDLYNNKINLCIITIILINYYNKKYNINLNNLYVISNLYKSYLLIITKLKYNILNINEIPYKTKIGILNESNPIYFFIYTFLKDLKYNKNDLEIIVYKNIDELHDAFIKDKIKLMIYLDKLPNNKLNELINFNFERDIILLPFNIIKKLKEEFLIKNDFLLNDTFNLNKIANSYLPKKFANYHYTIYKPDFQILSINHYLITNNKISNDNIYNITELILKNIKKINLILNEKYKINNIGPRININKYLKYHPNTLRIFKEFGYITNENNDNCKYLVGVKECNKKTLENNGFNI